MHDDNVIFVSTRYELEKQGQRKAHLLELEGERPRPLARLPQPSDDRSALHLERGMRGVKPPRPDLHRMTLFGPGCRETRSLDLSASDGRTELARDRDDAEPASGRGHEPMVIGPARAFGACRRRKNRTKRARRSNQTPSCAKTPLNRGAGRSN